MAKVEIGRIKNQEIGDWRLEIGDWRLEIGDWRLEIGDWNLELGTWNLAGKMERGCGDLGWLRQEGMGRE
jgi:hypothetical protein